MKTNTFILIIIVAAIAVGIGLYLKPHPRAHALAIRHGKHLEIWYCPMHPQIIYDHPGRCPICGMDLVQKLDAPQQQGSATEGYTTISVTTQRQQLIGLRTQVVGIEPVVKSIRSYGTIASDAELYQTQSEFIDAYVAYVGVFRDYKNMRDRLHIWESHRDLQTRLLDAKDKLLKLGLSDGEIAKLQDVSWDQIWKQPKLLLFNDNRTYWVMAQIFEGDLGLVHEGQKVKVGIPSYQETIKGVIRSVGGFIDPTNRSVTVLIELMDNDRHLAANMQVDISIPVNLGNAILVPREAVMDTGIRKIVFVQENEGTFEPREIQTGMETDDGYEVTSGLKEGERIVVSGNFLLDSESRVQAGLQASTAAAEEKAHE